MWNWIVINYSIDSIRNFEYLRIAIKHYIWIGPEILIERWSVSVWPLFCCQRCYEVQQRQVPDSRSTSKNFCSWCSAGVNLICCDVCPAMFCKSCIRRNLGRDFLDTILNTGSNRCVTIFPAHSPSPSGHVGALISIWEISLGCHLGYFDCKDFIRCPSMVAT